MLTKVLLVAAGGAIGSVARYLCAHWIQRLAGDLFPVGTLAVNVLGCLCIGALAAAFAGPNPPRDVWRIALGVGLLGGFTTFSTFGLDTFLLVQEKHVAKAGANLLLTNGLCLAAVWIGYRAAARAVGA